MRSNIYGIRIIKQDIQVSWAGRPCTHRLARLISIVKHKTRHVAHGSTMPGIRRPCARRCTPLWQRIGACAGEGVLWTNSSVGPSHARRPHGSSFSQRAVGGSRTQPNARTYPSTYRPPLKPVGSFYHLRTAVKVKQASSPPLPTQDTRSGNSLNENKPPNKIGLSS